MKKKLCLFIFTLLAGTGSLLAYTNLSPEEVHLKLVNGDTLLLLDVREIDEYHEGHIAEPAGQLPLTPVLMPWNSEVLSNQYVRLPVDVDIIVYCGSGGRSASASDFLESQGLTRIFNMTSGFSGWPYEERGGGYGDHSGRWVYASDIYASVVSCTEPGNPSQMVFPPDAVFSGEDSFYVELHEGSDYSFHPPDVPAFDQSGLYRISVFDRFGLTLFDGDSLSLNKSVVLTFFTTRLGSNFIDADMKGYISGKGWQPVSYDFYAAAFYREEFTLRQWYFVGGDLPSAVQMSGSDLIETVRAFPNPFNSIVQIEAPQDAKIAIYDMRGRLVDRPVSHEWSPEGSLVSGVYFIQVQFKNRLLSRKVIYLK